MNSKIKQLIKIFKIFNPKIFEYRNYPFVGHIILKKFNYLVALIDKFEVPKSKHLDHNSYDPLDFPTNTIFIQKLDKNLKK